MRYLLSVLFIFTLGFISPPQLQAFDCSTYERPGNIPPIQELKDRLIWTKGMPEVRLYLCEPAGI